jgi:hypothetical protein
MRDISVEALFPQRRERFEWASSSGWSRVLGIDAVGGLPHGDCAYERAAHVTSSCSPDWRGVTLAGLFMLNRPGFGGGIDPTEGWSHVSTAEVSA